MLLALRNALLDAGGANLDLGSLAREIDADPEVVRATLVHAIERGWITGAEVVGLPAGCGSSGCRPDPVQVACRRCPLAR